VGGTRNCDWWLSNDAVILDTAGRWATQEVEAIGPREDGDWALFRLLGQGVGPARNGDVLSLWFESAFGSGRVQVDFAPEEVRELFARFALPRSITPGAAACRK